MSGGYKIRLFTGLPKTQNAAFENIRTWGAFLVSARLLNGIISNVKILSEKGRLCTVINPWSDKKVLLVRNGKKAETIEGNRISFKTAINETVELRSM